MPVRLVRDGILTSEAVNSLNWAEEVFYRRLLSVVDDFGRYFASPKLLRAACYPLHIDKVSDSDIGKWLAACATAALVRVYPAPDGKSYIEVQRFNQQIRAKTSKYPQPSVIDYTCIADAKQLITNVHLDVSGFVSEVVSPPPIGVDLFDEFWKAYPNKTGKDAARKAFDKRKPTRGLLDSMLTAIGVQRVSKKWTDQGGQFIPNPSTWLNEGRWQDEGVQAAPAGTIATVPSKPGRDPEIEKAERDMQNRAAPSLATLAAIAKIKQGIAA
jgi:hypothetical protein